MLLARRFTAAARKRVLRMRAVGGGCTRRFAGNARGGDPLRPSVLLVNHGFPPLFNAGSEVYTQTLAHGLVDSGRCAAVSVLAREHDPFRCDYELRQTTSPPTLSRRSAAAAASSSATSTPATVSVPVRLINHPREVPYTRPLNADIRARFEEVLRATRPNAVAFQHLNHLSLDLPQVAKRFGAVTTYTLHDMWLTLCPRGQLVVCGAARAADGQVPYALCSGQNNAKCAAQCYTNRFGTGATTADGTGPAGANGDEQQTYWEQWVATRMEAARAAVDSIDAFVAPSQHLMDLVLRGSPVASASTPAIRIPREKVVLMPYGFDRRALSGRTRVRRADEPFVFGYIGRHSATKGIHLLLEAAAQLMGQRKDAATAIPPFRVLVFGRPDAATAGPLRALAAQCGDGVVQFVGEYDNRHIVRDVFDRVDAIVVPSIWEENSPLVIAEAQQTRVPVLTAARGGMGELVRDSVNGLTFDFRSATSLAHAMIRALRDPAALDALGRRGSLWSADGQVPCIEQHIDDTIALFRRLIHTNTNATTTATSDAKAVAASTDAEASASAALSAAPNAAPATAAADVPALRPAPITPLAAPWRITLDTNPDDCNFSCVMCEQHSVYSPHQKARKARGERRRRMDFAVIERVLRESVPRGTREVIPSTMGEPLMYRDAQGRSLVDVIALCAELGVRLNLTTNGSFHSHVGLSVGEWAALLLPVLSDVKFSWNGADAATNTQVMRGSLWAKQLANLQAFVRARNAYVEGGGRASTITLQCTFMRSTASKLPDLVRFAIANGVDRVKGHHLWAHFQQIKAEDMRHSAQSVGEWNAIAAECQRIAAATPLPNGKTLKLEHFEPLSLESSARGGELHPQAVCPFLGREAWVNHSGEFNPCCAPDEQRRALGSFGAITAANGLAGIWSSPQYQALTRDYDRHALCRGCSMRKPPAEAANTSVSSSPSPAAASVSA